MYATIKGSLTENDGVVSGFSQSNYLITQDVFPLQSTNFEIVTRIKNTATDSNERCFVSSRYRTAFIIGTTRVSANTFTFRLYGGNSTGTGASWNKASEQITIDETQFFDVKFTYNGTEYALYVNGTKIISYTSSTALYGNDYMYYGKWDAGSNTNIFVGSIDLNNSYIKLGSTKYNLQAVVGYTVVGSPTITDGVVSGFNSTASGGASNDYITLPSFTLNSDDDFDFVCRGNYQRVSASQYFFYSQHFGIYHSGTNTLQFVVVDSGGANKYLNGDFTPSGDFVYVRITKVGNIYTTYASDDGKIWTQLNSSTTITPATTRTSTNNRFGMSSGGYSIFNGSIDLNNTYIKINNKLWFNGQQS